MAEEKLEAHGLQKIVNKDVVKKEASIEKKLRNVFISEDVDGIGDYLIWSVIVPAIRGMLQDAGHGIVDGIFGGGGGRRSGGYYDYRGSSRRSSRYDDEPSYRSSYKRRDREVERDREYAKRSRKKESLFYFNSRADAEEVRDVLIETIDRYGFASISDINELCGFDNSDHTDTKWGWRSLRKSNIRSSRDGYVLELPLPESLED